MPTDKIKFDATDAIEEVKRWEAVLKAQGSAVKDLTVKYADFNKTGSLVKIGFQEVYESGLQLEGFLKKSRNTWYTHLTSISENSAKLKELAAAQRDVAKAAGASSAQDFFSKNKLLDTAGLSASFASAAAGAQQALAKAMEGGSAQSKAAVERIYQEILSGNQKVASGIDASIQKALLRVLAVEERITNEKRKQASAANIAPGVSQTDLAKLRGVATGFFPVNDKASFESILRYQQAINSLINLASRGVVPLGEFQRLLGQLRNNPIGDFSFGDKNLLQAQTSIQRVISAYNGMTASAKAAEQQGAQTGRSLFITFDQFSRLLQYQVIHRVFGNFITAMQGAIGAAAVMQQKISEIRTISQGSGLGFSDLQSFIRSTSEQFNRPQTDVAEALYQAFSNQIIKTREDLSSFNEIMRFSRIAVTDATTAVNLASTAINSYGLSASQVRPVLDGFFKAIEIGRFRASDVADSMGRILPIASQIGVKWQEAAGLLAELTRNGVSASEAMTQISSIMQAMLKPNKELDELIKSWGYDSGVAAVRGMGFVEVLRQLSIESQRGGARIGELFNNVRALRGIFGSGTAGGNLGGLRSAIDQISNASQSAAEATTIVSESPGEKFRKQLVGVQNFFTNDFANSFIEKINQITEHFGGLDSITKQIGGSIVNLGQVLTVVAGGSAKVASGINAIGLDLGSLIKLYAAYKASVVALSLAEGAKLAYDTAIAHIENIKATSIIASTTATQLATSASVQQAFATGNLTGINLTQIATLNAATAAQQRLTTAQVVGTIAAKALTSALTAGLAGIVAGVAYAVSSFDPLVDRLNTLESLSNRLRDTNQRSTERDQKFEQNLSELAQGDLTGRTAAIQRAIAAVRKTSEEMLEAQKKAVAAATEVMRENARVVEDQMSKIVSTIRERLHQAEELIKSSKQHEASFADRDASTMFQHALKNTHNVSSAQGINYWNQDGSINMQAGMQAAAEAQHNRAQQIAYAQQLQLIEERIATIKTEAQRLATSGNKEDIESARRKFQEIRHLTEQAFDIRTQAARDNAATAAHLGGGGGMVSYQVDLERLRQEINRVTEAERELEQQHRRTQEQAQRQAQAQEKIARQNQQRLNDSIKAIQNFDVTNQGGNLKDQYTGPQGMARFRQDYAALMAQVEEAMRRGGISAEAALGLQTSLINRRAALEAQIERQITNDRLAAISQRVAAEEAAIRRLSEAADKARDQARTAADKTVSDIPKALADMAKFFQQEVSKVSAWDFTREDRTNPLGVHLRELQAQFTQQSQSAQSALVEYNRARGTDREAAALENLQARTRAAADTYRQLLALISGNAAPIGQRQGNTPIEQLIQSLTQSRSSFEQAKRDLQQAEQRSQALETQLGLLPPRLRDAAAGMNNLGQQAAQQALQIRNLANEIQNLTNQVDNFRKAAGLPPAAANPPGAQQVEGFAEGGLIGGAFNTSGPDNRLITARDGEFIMNPSSTRQWFSQLVAMNTGRLPSFAEGGVVGSTTNVGDVTINVQGSTDPRETAKTVFSLFKRELRRGNVR